MSFGCERSCSSPRRVSNFNGGAGADAGAGPGAGAAAAMLKP